MRSSKYQISILSLFAGFCGFAQVPDSSIQKKYPTIRPVIVQYERFTGNRFEGDINDYGTVKGNSKEVSRFNAMLSFPILVKMPFVITGTMNYSHQEFGVSVDDYPKLPQDHFYVDDLTFAVGGVYIDSLWNRPFVVSGSMSFKTRQFKDMDRFKYTISTFYTLKKTKKTTLSIGLVGIIDPMSQIPILPMVGYSYNFPNTKWVFEGLLPYRAYFRRDVLDKGWLSLGGEINGSSFFADGGRFAYANDHELSNAEVWAGGIFEYPLSPWIMGGFKTGIRTNIQTQLRDTSSPSKDAVVESKFKPSAYFNFSLSLTIPQKESKRKK